ncbi:RNA polymerase sigma factor [Kribbella albertanoniae]|uniref:Sigma-70 family RNA polymerase sigma factor n=1 Tax=Kribbella albertanoniae TaxID=1266829 RepID=A0A4R4QJ98_9ACTN|nr:sigma-70 family RNA polymerase sigma factor [Kribbella albertanoniae]TDC35767.1 sigma-70 family RNA polymerase sigma factor [Kribbella albertanoniae]
MSEPGPVDLERLYREHYRAVLRYVVRRTGDRADADDVVADVFLVAWQRRAELPAAHALPWLYRVAANVLSDVRRSEERAGRAYERVGSDLATWVEPVPGDRLMALEAAGALLEPLSPKDREVLMLHAWEGLRGKDLATALGCSVTSASVRLHRARHRAQRHLTAAGALDAEPGARRSGSTVVTSGKSRTQGESS